MDENEYGQAPGAGAGTSTAPSRPVLEIANVTTEFRSRGKGRVPVVRDVSLTVRKGETLGIVGESGSGKSMSMISALGLAPYVGGRVVSGRAVFDGADLLTMDKRQLQQIRGGQIGVVFQDPMTSLNPVRTVERQIVETIRKHDDNVDAEKARQRAIELLKMVRIPDAQRRLTAYPHELSGGMRQRVMIAIALACEPELIIADEPTTALDVTVQLDILNLLWSRTSERELAVVIVSHDLGVIASMADRIAVMYAGTVVEEGPATSVLRDPQHPYTLGLLNSIPSVDQEPDDHLPSIPGLPPRPDDVPTGCAFHDRCPFATQLCREQDPALDTVHSSHGDNRKTACHYSLVGGQAVTRER